eukprot:TRINITY_DN38894_c0_g1_i1.p1 TRINITY_DN38894_c0_g1~~TRINITY_DN38894_c0_g1_i1.p1  ORF type:complete len:325 (+),score=68.95 TRINITY_DN38894_c0_g1_i1:153-1127(+)
MDLENRHHQDEVGARLIRMAAECKELAQQRGEATIDAEEAPMPVRSAAEEEGQSPREGEGGASSEEEGDFGAHRESQESLMASPSGHPGDTVIIFDWDDTLLPTWFVTEVVSPCLPDLSAEDSVPADSDFAQCLIKHAHMVRETLKAARRIARVGIVTLAQRPWVKSSASKYLLDKNFMKFLKELEIPVVYARECIQRPIVSMAQVEEGVNVFTVAKQQAMLKVLRRLSGTSSSWRNVLSIGDSQIERDAMTDIMWCHEAFADVMPHCKTVKLMQDPTVEQLGAQLLLLGMWLPAMARFDEDFEITMDDSEETLMQLQQRFMEQ